MSISPRTAVVFLAVAVLSLAAGQAGASATFYWSTVAPGGATPVAGNASVTLNQGETGTLYLWAQLKEASSNAFGIDFLASQAEVITPTAVTLDNPVDNWMAPTYSPGNPTTWKYRWNAYTVHATPQPAGFRTVGGFNIPDGLNSCGLTTGFWDDIQSPTQTHQYYLGSFSFEGNELGSTGLFLMVNSELMIGDLGMLGTTAAPALHFGLGDAAVATSYDAMGDQYYIAEGVHSTLADATITVVPEPATVGLMVIGTLALLRRR